MIQALVIEPAQGVIIYGVRVEVGIPHNNVLHNSVLIGLSLRVVVLLVAVGQERGSRLRVGSRLLEDLTLGIRLPLLDILTAECGAAFPTKSLSPGTLLTSTASTVFTATPPLDVFGVFFFADPFDGGAILYLLLFLLLAIFITSVKN